MERTVPSTISEEVELYTRTYYSLLRTTAEVQIRALEEAHARMNALLHPGARDQSPDVSAFIYCLLRMPPEMPKVELVVIGQSMGVLAQAGYEDIYSWEQVSAVARRRRCFYDGIDTLAFIIASRTDIDDIIPMLTAYQIEWNKLHTFLQNLHDPLLVDRAVEDPEVFDRMAGILNVASEDLENLRIVWGDDFVSNLKRIAAKRMHLRVRLLSGSLSEYRRATSIWWENIEQACPQLRERPVYFVSSNTHSLVNLISGFAWQNQDELVEFLEKKENLDLLQEWKQIQTERVPSSRENFFYYAFKKYQQSNAWADREQRFVEHEQSCGIMEIPSEQSFDVHAQVIDLSKLNPLCLDPRLDDDISIVSASEALILNIDYPLGLAAYNILSKVAEHVGAVLGVYIIGKAASLNGAIGDITIPNVVHDEQSRNTYLISNCFTANDVAPFLVYGTVLDNQKAVSVPGTFLQNAQYMDVFYREGYTDIEMEAGPYLSAIYEMYRPKRHPIDEIVNLNGVPFDIGVLHYVSDTPMSKGGNLGAGSLSYFGMDSTYAASLAVLRRIFIRERDRLQTQRSPLG